MATVTGREAAVESKAAQPDTREGAILRTFATQLWADVRLYRRTQHGRPLDGCPLEGLCIEWPARWTEYAVGIVRESNGAGVGRLELKVTGEGSARVSLFSPGASFSRVIYHASKSPSSPTGWVWNAEGLAKRLLEQRDLSRAQRAGVATAAQATAARAAWCADAVERLRGMLDAKDRVDADRAESLIVTCNATDATDPQEWPVGDTLTLPLMWNEAGQPVAVGMQTGRTGGGDRTSTFDLPTLRRALRYVALVATWVEAANAR